ncbi:sodium-dependent proline transporter-like [Episyrphus balteatus]|uniref:sodium-dependent proline transporter-like n=1 Tax=Episyrphus balteatus TaxID=286459 RepID=UPI0024860FB0|nr:sodium-dependent proline transporter-like [Episyrphus balteatus]
MEYETSYDTGLKPFNHDKNRGKWASSKDFFFACAGHAFKADAILIMPILIFEDFGIYALIMYFITLAFCVVPIVFLQSFLGQFSGTGFISVFRISPLFKGIGYVSLVVNFLTLTYYSIFSAIPLLYFFNTLRPAIPWSCEGSKEWDSNYSSICIHNASNPTYFITNPSVDFFRNPLDIETYRFEVTTILFSLELMVCTCIIWGIVTFVILNSTEIIGRIIRYSFLSVVAIMSICLIRFAFLPGAFVGIWEFIFPHKRHFWETWIMIPGIAFATLGPGYGSILTMASFNNFKTNIFKYSWLLCLAQCGLMMGMAYLSIFIKCFMEALRPESRGYYEKTDHQWLEFLNIPTGLTFMELSHFWSLLFFSMLILGSLNILD